jgi:hypothetical protein
LPTASIDTFFACSLLVSVTIIATAFLAGSMQTQIGSMQGLNQQDFLRVLSDHLVSGYGSPQNWGSASGVPIEFGLSGLNAQGLTEIDKDKISRLNSLNGYALPYFEAFQAAKVDNIAFGVSVSQILQVKVAILGSVDLGSSTNYAFQVSVTQDGRPIAAELRGYALAAGFETVVSGSTSGSGVGSVSCEIPNSAGGPGLLVVFARASFDDRMTAYAAYPFTHSSVVPQPNLTFLALGPLDSQMNATVQTTGVSVSAAYAFSFAYQSSLASGSSSTYATPNFVDKSPTVLVVQGNHDGQAFNEWTAYPQVPLDFGSDLSRHSSNLFVYPVTIDGCLYKLTMRFGDVIR